jgi:hypothetical protein
MELDERVEYSSRTTALYAALTGALRRTDFTHREIPSDMDDEMLEPEFRD